MPEILPDHVPSPRTPLVWDGTAYRAVRGHTDGTLQVRGEDQLFSFAGVLAETRTAGVSGAGGWLDSDAVPAGEIWCVTGVHAVDNTSPTTCHYHRVRHNGVSYSFNEEIRAFATGDGSSWEGHKWLDEGDTIRGWFTGSLAGDSCTVTVTGYIMTLET